MAANKSRIVLGGKVFGFLRMKGNSPEASSLLATEEPRVPRPSAEEPQTMIEWFMFESGASSDYIKDYVKNEKADVFFLIEKEKPIGFFSILRKHDKAHFGSLYIKREFRKGYGNLLVARALKIARRSGSREFMIPSMTDEMRSAAMKAVRGAKTVKTHEMQWEEGDRGPDMVIGFHKRPNKRQRASMRRRFR